MTGIDRRGLEESGLFYLNARDRAQPAGQDAAAEGAEAEPLSVWQDRLNGLPIIRHLGARFDLGEPPIVQVHVDAIAPFHRGGMAGAAVNGAVLSALADCALGGTGIVEFPGIRSGTVSLTMHFLRPLLGNSIAVRCVPVRKSASLLFADIEILDSRRRVCATASGIVSAVAPRAAEADTGRSSEPSGET
jgi:acyl-coenzyme A thioesterase PaaI-like protein